MKLVQKNNSGFTLVEVMLATTIAMALMFGALYSTSETLAVVREGDAVTHTNVHARRTLDRLLKDFRYSSDLAVSGNAADGWEITVTTTGTLNPGDLIYSWDPAISTLEVTDGTDVETVIEELRSFEIDTEEVDLGSGPVISRITLAWSLGLSTGSEAGNVGLNNERTYEISGATWIRRNDSN